MLIPEIVFEDNHIIVVNKPNGILSQKDITGDDSIIEYIKAYIKEKYSKPGEVYLGSVHRLDRGASGLMVFARTSKALTRLNKSLKDGEFSKQYYAIVSGTYNKVEGQLKHFLLKNTNDNIVHIVPQNTKNAKLALLKYKMIKSVNILSLLEINLGTGRPHQIRVQLKEEFSPILGDVKYGSKIKNNMRKIYLHCFQLAFPHPISHDIVTFHKLPDKSDPVWGQFL